MNSNIQDLLQFVQPSLLWLIPILVLIGKIAKEAKSFKDWLIPLTLLCVSMVLSVSYVIFAEGFIPMNVWSGIAQGLIVWALAVAGHATYKQVSQKRGD